MSVSLSFIARSHKPLYLRIITKFTCRHQHHFNRHRHIQWWWSSSYCQLFLVSRQKIAERQIHTSTAIVHVHITTVWLFQMETIHLHFVRAHQLRFHLIYSAHTHVHIYIVYSIAIFQFSVAFPTLLAQIHRRTRTPKAYIDTKSIYRDERESIERSKLTN